jgi:hypothetical protein
MNDSVEPTKPCLGLIARAVLMNLILPCRCQAWERDEDPDARQLPRAKCHDDKALAAVQLDRSTRSPSNRRDPAAVVCGLT